MKKTINFLFSLTILFCIALLFTIPSKKPKKVNYEKYKSQIVHSITQQGNTLVIRFANGEQLIVKNVNPRRTK